MKLKTIEKTPIKMIISSELDAEGFFISKKQIINGHILFEQFKKSFHSAVGNKTSFTSSKDTIINDLNYYYSTHPEIKEKFELVNKRWNDINQKYLQTCSDIFLNDFICHQELITVYPSLWGIGILNMNAEAVSYNINTDNVDEMIYVIIHELLHIYFYSYLNNVFNIDFSKISEKEIWDMAEIFNSIVLGKKEFKVFFPQYNFINYPEHQDKIVEISGKILDFNIKNFLKVYNELFLKNRLVANK